MTPFRQIIRFCLLLSCVLHAKTALGQSTAPERFEFLPISMMEDSQLERSAAFWRERSTTTDQCLLNMMWLMADTDHQYAAHAPVRLFRDRLERHWDQRSLIGTNLSLDEVSLIQDQSTSYRLRTGAKHLAIQYRYQF